MKDTENEVKKPSPFDLYFDSCEDEFLIKLYEVPRVPGRKAAKEWIEDFENEKPSEEYIATFYGAGHYWVMGTDKDGKIKSKDIHISDRAVQRILKRTGSAAPVANSSINNLAAGGTPQSLDSFVGVLEKLMTGVIAPLINAQHQPASPVAQLEDYSNRMLGMFQKNMEAMNNQIMGFSKKIANEHLSTTMKHEQKEEQSPGWIGELITGVKPYLDKFLDAQGVAAEIYKEQLQKGDKFQSILANDDNLNAFFNGLADDPDIGEKKAMEVFQKFGFTPIYDNPQTSEPAQEPAPDTQFNEQNERTTKTH